jgi:hypothetical protein
MEIDLFSFLPLLKKVASKRLFQKNRTKHVYNATFDATFLNFDATFFKSGKRGLEKKYYVE